MIDHFSKYGWIVVLSHKSAITELIARKACIATHGKPESLQTDNGSKFVNEELKMYLSKNRIHHIRGFPYHQSQVAVEDLIELYRTVQNYLYLAKDINEKEFIIEDLILDFLLYNNKSVHTTTRYSPYDIMEKKSNEKITMKKVRENTLKSR